MANRYNTSEWLKRLEEGTAEIYSRYQRLADVSRANYDAKRKALDREYADAANALSATSKIDLKNSLERMADAGYVTSGETVHATLAANTAKMGALSQLEQKKAEERSELDRLAMEEETERSNQASREAADFRREMEESARDQANRDREFEAAEKQRAFENQMAQEKWALEKETQTKASTSASKKSEEEDEGLRPSRSVHEFLQDIVDRNTKVYENKGYKVENRTAIAKAIEGVVKDENISARYRYELYLYAKSLGYVKTK